MGPLWDPTTHCGSGLTSYMLSGHSSRYTSCSSARRARQTCWWICPKWSSRLQTQSPSSSPHDTGVSLPHRNARWHFSEHRKGKAEEPSQQLIGSPLALHGRPLTYCSSLGSRITFPLTERHLSEQCPDLCSVETIIYFAVQQLRLLLK